MDTITADKNEVADRSYRQSVVVDALSAMKVSLANVDQARAVGLSAVHLTAVRPRHDLKPALLDIAAVREFIDANPDKLLLAKSAAEIHEAKKSGRLAVVMGLQDSKPIRDDLALLRTLYDLGVRIVQLTHNTQNYIGTGCLEPDHGVTRFGRKVIAEMNRLGLIIDIAHCGPKTSLDAIEISERPVLCSHANPKAISASPRNKSDEVIERLAARGGVIGIASWSPMTYRGNGKRPTLSDVLDCFDHAIRLVGSDHVGIGTDLCDGLYTSEQEWLGNHGPQGTYPEVTGGLGSWYGFETWYAEGMASMADLPNLARGLMARGHKVADVQKILGVNVLRVIDHG